MFADKSNSLFFLFTIIRFHYRAAVLSDDAEQVFFRLGIKVRVLIIHPLQGGAVVQPQFLHTGKGYIQFTQSHVMRKIQFRKIAA